MRIQPDNLCPHCDPYPSHRLHLVKKLELLLFPITVLLNPAKRLWQKFPQFHLTINNLIISSFFKAFLALGILQEVEAQDSDEQLYNRSLVVVREARKRGLVIKSLKLFNKRTNHFSLEIKGIKKFFEGLPYVTAGDFDDKAKLKELLKKVGLPHPQGRTFRDYWHALQYVRNVLGFPVVIKPRSGSLSKHTTCNIKSESQLQAAVKIVKIISREFIVEEFIEGSVHRVTVVNSKVVAACLREPPNIIGDGKHTIRELIEIKNQNPLRGLKHQRNFTLHKIIVNARTNSLLAAYSLNLDSVLPNNQKAYLHDKVILACGADIHDTTDKIHSKNEALFEQVYKLCNTPLIGIDFIIKDISKPYYRQKCAIIEVNSLPYIDMHHYPVTGKSRNVASHLLDYCLSL